MATRDEHEQITVIRAYLRQWIMAPVWRGEEIDALRTDLEVLTSQQAIAAWLHRARDLGIDPL